MKGLLVLLLLFSFCTVKSQIFYDDFSDNSNNWTLYSKSDASVNYKGGLYIEQKDNEVNAYITKGFSNIVANISEIECSMIKYEGEIGIGLIWNFKGEETHNRFIITTRDNEYFIQYRGNGERNNVQEWTNSSAVLGGDAENTLKLKQAANSVEFYVNDVLVHTQENSDLSLDKIGIMLGCYGGARCKINYFKVTGDKATQINQPHDITEINQKEDTVPISMEGYAANNLVLLLDVSGSMNAEDKLPLLRSTFLEILPYLRDEDEISIVAFSGNGKVLLNPISCSNKDKITEVLQSLESKGGSNFSQGIKLAYKTAKFNFKNNANNRIIIATDGAFSVDKQLYKLAEKQSSAHIKLSIFSFGNKSKKVEALEKLATLGKGNYEIVQPLNAIDKLLKELQVFE